MGRLTHVLGCNFKPGNRCYLATPTPARRQGSAGVGDCTACFWPVATVPPLTRNPARFSLDGSGEAAVSCHSALPIQQEARGPGTGQGHQPQRVGAQQPVGSQAFAGASRAW